MDADGHMVKTERRGRSFEKGLILGSWNPPTPMPFRRKNRTKRRKAKGEGHRDQVHHSRDMMVSMIGIYGIRGIRIDIMFC